MEKQNLRLRLLSYLVIAYMMMAFSWWTVLLFTKNRDAFAAKSELLKIGMIAQGIVKNDLQFTATPEFQSLSARYTRQEWMIVGEAVVFVISLVLGVYFINRGYNKEMVASQQSRNFLLSITHELKSPIASIRLVLETLLRRELPKEKTTQLQSNALKETERLNTLVNNLLFSAKLESSYQAHKEPLDLHELLEEIIHKLSDKYPDAQFSFEQEDELPYFQGDKMGMISVALNLLENAVKYSGNESKAHIETHLGMNNAEQIKIEIKDQGLGIPEKEKKQIFQKFYRVGSEDTRTTKGTGLGLYIVDQIVRAHAGRINVYDNEPKGTVFEILLPVGQN
ncbi:sensor histidine kinase [Haliscomenobacter hydrossis]|uniref:histidine kinase n=1 Tax=Haliscomenobacter hydrossis (strain ATCC 27775 / DSM 1100 / LMG 10767 / O) TaxID=760192 RepID=F4KTG4_HALH1|nr:ATP-binding protein [Haliscomenobacter hydrossis]AEE52378.1 integral membrane sensor signal transduction histidine kinase [Haliscomenobacter hydrossis DSM 1100]